MGSFDDGAVHIDVAQRRVVVVGHPVDLAPAVSTVLTRLVSTPRDLVPDDELARLTGVSPQRIRSVVVRLRQKLGSDDPWRDEGSPIEHVAGLGYRWRSDVRPS